jgi:predicted ATPase
MSVFVGRVAELALLAEISVGARRGEVAAAVVVGDPGSGKSRLLAEIADQAELANRFRVIGYEAERHVPLASAADLLRALTALAPVGHRLDTIMFDSGDEGSVLEPVQVFEAAHRVLRTADPTLILVDDLQWVDEHSIA